MQSTGVAIPLYNHERYIGPAIDSILAQSCPVEKIVIVDDGSTDGSLAAARQFRDERITILTQQNSGAHVALNRAIGELAECEFTAILNSDDIYHPERISRCVEFLQAHSQHEAVCTRFSMIDESGRRLEDREPKMRWVNSVWAARSENLPAWFGISNFTKTTSNLVGRTGYFQSHPFRDYRYVHDYFFALRCALEEKLGVLNEELLFYRAHGSNTIKADGSARVAREVLRMNFDLLRELAPELEHSCQIRHALAQYFRELMQNHADFRAEIFLAVIAKLLPSQTPDAGDYPELSQPSERLLKQRLLDQHERVRSRRLADSPWVRLGRKLGFIPRDLFP